jgi:GNAT superfamily N-acetyltransferase
MTLLVRAAEAADIERLVTLNRATQELHVEARRDIFHPVRSEDMVAWFTDLLANPSVRVWVAKDDAVVGYAVVRVRETEASPFCPARTWWELDEIGVDAAHRRRGVARALVERIVAEARPAGLPALELNCWSFNLAAQQAFASLGFTPMTTRLELLLQNDLNAS